MKGYHLIFALLVLYLVLYGFPVKQTFKEFFTAEQVIQNPTYLQQTAFPEELQYQEGVIQHQDNQIRKLRKQVKRLAEHIDDGDDGWTKKFYRRKLSNKYYPVVPQMAIGIGQELNLHDDDFSNKTLSTIKFLSQTQKSKYYGTEVHFPTELCGNFCSTSDPNAQFHEQIDLVRPITPANKVPKTR